MKKLSLLIAVLVFVLFSAHSQSFSDFIDYVNSLPEEDRTPVIDSFMNAVEPIGFPYITGDSANFIYRGEVANVKVAGDFNGWDPGFYFMSNVAGTDFYHRTWTFEMNARLDYKFVIDNSSWILDPLNPNTCSGGYGPNSELAMPDYVQPWEIESYPGTNQGTVLTDQISSINTSSNFQLRIYLPYGYDENLPGGYPVVYFQDGIEYISLGYADNVLDNLIDSNLCSPVIGVFVKPNNRNEEYAGSLRDKYRLFFVEELVPYIDENFNTIQEARGRAIMGDSFGGNISALISYQHPDIFGNCGLHSGAFWPNDYEAYHMVVDGEIKPIRWSSIWGTYEGLWENMRAFRDSLTEFGYDFKWMELPEGHSWGLWRATIDEIVPHFFPPEFMGTGENTVPLNEDLIIYPNPSRGIFDLQFTVNDLQWITCKIYDLQGKEVVTVIDKPLPAGDYKLNVDTRDLPHGVYFCIVSTVNSKQTKSKLIIIN
jgi:enterochelin esterase family protein